jgi:hypothetical protein
LDACSNGVGTLVLGTGGQWWYCDRGREPAGTTRIVANVRHHKRLNPWNMPGISSYDSNRSKAAATDKIGVNFLLAPWEVTGRLGGKNQMRVQAIPPNQYKERIAASRANCRAIQISS